MQASPSPCSFGSICLKPFGLAMFAVWQRRQSARRSSDGGFCSPGSFVAWTPSGPWHDSHEIAACLVPALAFRTSP